eukprot:6545889-Prymnesium_polylepis.1
MQRAATLFAECAASLWNLHTHWCAHTSSLLARTTVFSLPALAALSAREAGYASEGSGWGSRSRLLVIARARRV